MTSRDPANLLGSYLRARRERVTPDDVGLASHGARRRDRLAIDGEPDLSLVVLHGPGLAGVLADPRPDEALVAS